MSAEPQVAAPQVADAVVEPRAAEANVGEARPRTQAIIGALLLVLAAALFFDATRLPPPRVHGVGPSAALRLVGVALAILGVAHLVVAWRRRGAAGAVEHGNLGALAWVFSALVGLMAVLHLGGGFILGTTWLFAGTARGFGERFSVKSIGIGLVLCTLVYAFFTRALSLGLPAGPIERLLLG